ncbi:MAG: ABC transporter substrate-binding protein [Gemmatimonadota bacterium]
MRIVSLLPAATEIVAAVGALPELVGVSHECDFPEAVRQLPRVTTTPIDPGLASSAIDEHVRALVSAGRAVIAIDTNRLRQLTPTHIITQDLCEVCAVSDGEAVRLAAVLDPPPVVVSLSGRTLDGVWQSIASVGAALGREAEGQRVSAELSGRMATLRASAATSTPRQVLCIEWLAPPFTAGHWVPEMVEAAGGIDIGAAPGDHSAERDWAELNGLNPDIVIIMLCGMDVARSQRELAILDDPDALDLLGRVPVWIIDGNAYTSRPGPRLVEGTERIAAALVGRGLSGLKRWRQD